MKQLKIMALALMTGLTATAQTPKYLDDSQPLEVRVQDALSRMTTHEKIMLLHAQSKFTSAGVPRLGIRQLNMDDGPHGVREELEWNSWAPARWTNDSIVAFPSLTCLAATWNSAMSAIYGNAVSEEFAFRGKDVMLGPGVNMARTPLNGRNFEYMGEDPYLAGRMVVPYIKSAQANGVACCLKHFALNNQEIDRFAVNVNVDERALNEIYLPAFKAAVQEGGVWTVMPSYPLWNGVHCCQNDSLLNGILKRDWDFDGATISDWGGTTDTWQAATGGLDIEMGSFTDGKLKEAEFGYNDYYLADKFEKLINEGKVPMSVLDDKASRVLRTIFRTSMNRSRGFGSMNSAEHYATARRVAGEGIVLLKNEGSLLPIDTIKAKTVLVVGENAVKMMTVGGGSSSLKAQRETLPLDGLRKALGGRLRVDYARGYVGDTTGSCDGVTAAQSLADYRTPEELTAEAVAKAKTADYVIVFGGLNKSSNQDCEGTDRLQYGLPYGQDSLIEALAEANENLVYVNISGNPVAMPWSGKVKAIVQGWFLGSTAGDALADVLTGRVNPSGKLPYSWLKKLDDYAPHRLGTYPGTWRADKKIIDEKYAEGIYTGYRWVDKEGLKPLFAFGHGLSYTTFKIGKAEADKTELAPGDSITFTLDVTNTGRRAGAEVVQLYVHDCESTLPRPYKELKAFSKVSLEPGETKRVSLTIGRDALSYFDDKAHEWRAEPGRFEALIGNSSDNLTQKVKFTLTGN